MQTKYDFKPKEISRMEIDAFLNSNKIIDAISKYVDPIILNKIINSAAIEFIDKSKYQLLDILETLFTVNEIEYDEEYIKVFLIYRDELINFLGYVLIEC